MKKVFLFAIIIIAILTFTMAISADQYGEQPYIIWDNDPSGWYVPLNQIGANENKYTLAINLGEYWNTNTNPNYEQEQITFYTKRENGNNGILIMKLLQESIILSGSDINTPVTISPQNYEDEYMLIPFQYVSSYTGTNETDLFKSYYNILNNEEYTGAVNIVEEDYQDYWEGYQAGFNGGLETGYQNGLEEGRAENQFGNAGKQLIFTVIETPFNVLRQMLNFEILGINIFGLLMSIFTLCAVAAVVKFII